MSAYHYIAIHQDGKEHKGVIEAENEKHARQLLRDKALLPVRIIPVQTKKHHNKSVGVNLRSTLSSKALAMMTRQFATLLSAGLPVEASLLAVGEQTQQSYLKGLIFAVRSKVMEGHSLSQALHEHPKAFSALFCATVAAGEKTGHLDKVLLRLAEYTEQQWQIRQKLKAALIYPVMMVLVAIVIVGFLLEYIVPKMVAVYAHINQTLPLLTTLLIGLSHFIHVAGIYMLMALLVGGGFCMHALKTRPPFRKAMHQLFLRLPLFGGAFKTADTARFSRTLSILSVSGVPLVEAMHIAAQLMTTIPIRLAVEEAVTRVREGRAIHLALKQTQFFPPMSVHMIACGEASGQLEEMLDRVAQNQENELGRLIDVALALFEPAIILIMGAIVLFIVLAVLLPIFQLNQFTQ